MTTPNVPPTHVDLLEKPLFAHLATVRPDGAPQSSVMWFGWDGSRVKFTHTRTRQKFRNLAHDARVAFSIRDETNPYRFLEVRGEVDDRARSGRCVLRHAATSLRRRISGARCGRTRSDHGSADEVRRRGARHDRKGSSRIQENDGAAVEVSQAERSSLRRAACILYPSSVTPAVSQIAPMILAVLCRLIIT